MSVATTAVITTLFVVSAFLPVLADGSGPDCVRRGEYANALSSMHELDPATRTAYLIMAGDLDGAAGQLDVESDGLLNAFVRFGLEDWPGVLEMSGRICRNRWLDIFRLHMRAVAFRELSMPDSVIAVTGRILPHGGSMSPPPKDHQLYDRLVDLRFEAFIDSGDERYRDEITPDIVTRLSRPTLLRIASDYLEKGDRGMSVDILRGLRTGGLEDTERGMVDELLERLLSDTEKLEEAVLADLCRSAMKAGLENTAAKMLDRLADSAGETWETAFLRGRLLENGDKLRLARRKYLEIFQSGAPVELKKESLLSIASIDYRIRHLDKSAENLRLFGVYYPSDRRAESVLDRAARIHIARGRPDKAIETWEILGRMGPVTRQGRAGVISQAVTQLTLGMKGGARKTLGRLITDGIGLMRDGACYWMYRSCDDPDSASVYLETLKNEYPLSIYTYSAGREKEVLLATPPGGSHDIAAMETSEKISGSRQFTAVPGGKDEGTAAVAEAFEYLIRNGLLKEAAECASTLAGILKADEDGLWYIYGILREKGMIRPSISILYRLTALETEEIIPWRLFYPEPYTGIIARSAESERVQPELILSVIREESLFEVKAVSSAGARGLMQLMPSTGTWISGKLRRDEPDQDEIFAPEFNIDAGTWYLRFLLDRSNDSLVGALASYNAGNAKMSSWRKTYKPWESPMIAMEMIGLDETREYVRRVLNSYAAYRTLYGAGDDNR